MKHLALIAALTLGAAPAMAQWSSYHAPGSPYTDHSGPDGWTGSSYHSHGSSYTDTTWHGPNGQTKTCTTYRAPGSSYADTTCN